MKNVVLQNEKLGFMFSTIKSLVFHSQDCGISTLKWMWQRIYEKQTQTLETFET